MFYLILQNFSKCWWILNFLLSLPVAKGIPLKHGTFPSSDVTVAEISKVVEQETVSMGLANHLLSVPTFLFLPTFSLYIFLSIFPSLYLPIHLSPSL